MIDVKEGQWVVSRGQYGYSVDRADKVTAKQIRSLRRSGSYSQVSRETVLFAGDEAQARAVFSAACEAENARRQAYREAAAAFEKETAPAKEIFQAARQAANIAERAAVLRAIEEASVDGSPEGGDGEAGSIAEGDDSAVPKGDAQ